LILVCFVFQLKFGGKIRGEEPQSYRDLALGLLQAHPKPSTEVQQRVEWSLMKVLESEWDRRFTMIELSALMVKMIPR
jgi:hypothetical protein